VEEAGFEPFVPRVTMTFPALALSKQLVVLAAGESKAGPIAAAFGEGSKPDPHVPTSLVPTLGRDVIVLLDPAAAQGLGRGAESQ
jgi:6-phosphogluconolactonase/glucosamine-6-phosphate isomerase/deaminase